VLKIDAEVMSKPDLREVVDFRVDYITQNTSNTTMKCHFDDGWGVHAGTDPKGLEGNQDCLMSRYNLCARSFSDQLGVKRDKWYDFTLCIFLNQKYPDTITDNMKGFNETAEYCATVTGHDYGQLKQCAESERGLELLQTSHLVDVALNTNVDADGHHHPDWVIIDGVNYGTNTTANWNWTALVCAAYKGPKPESCGGASAQPVVV